jgi:hypothetical protein
MRQAIEMGWVGSRVAAVVLRSGSHNRAAGQRPEPRPPSGATRTGGTCATPTSHLSDVTGAHWEAEPASVKLPSTAAKKREIFHPLAHRQLRVLGLAQSRANPIPDGREGSVWRAAPGTVIRTGA